MKAISILYDCLGRHSYCFSDNAHWGDDIIVAYGIISPVYYNEITGDIIVIKQVRAANRSG